ncbi:hypothetical protein PUW89_01490, partial [Metamycoplasma hyosynoviae]|uniref:type I restriction endonuclease subunit R, EcoR124 family n=1 Tax=Metamycoplasma hyosynoviae TaxID=29559 RepID=UPI002366BD67
INTLYLDKMLQNENIVQAFSRTNRLFGEDKPFGIIKYYRRPHTMNKLIKKAFEIYSGNKPFGIFVDKLGKRLKQANEKFTLIKEIFEEDGIEDFQKPPSSENKEKFKMEFKNLHKLIEAAKIQGFYWQKKEYLVKEDDKMVEVKLIFDENTYNILHQRYKDLFTGGGKILIANDFNLESSITTFDIGKIDYEYLNSKFKKWYKTFSNKDDESSSEKIEEIFKQLKKSLAMLSDEDQKYATLIINDIQSYDFVLEENKNLADYINLYRERAKSNQISKFAKVMGIDEKALKGFMEKNLNENEIDKFETFEKFFNENVKREVASKYIKKIYPDIKDNNVKIKAYNLTKKFILEKGFDI